MSVNVFNIALLLGWLLVSIGAGLIHIGAGFVVAGALLLLLTFIVARIGGLHAPRASHPQNGDR